MKAGRVLLYVQHLLGIGHLVRASRIATALKAAGLEVAVVTGGVPVSGFPEPGISVIALPPVRAVSGFSTLVDAKGEAVSEYAKEHRRDLLLSAVKEFRPQIVVTEAFPFGRRQMRFELMPMIDLARRMQPRPLIVSSIRDILQENAKPGRSEEAARLVENYFDLVLVHGDPAFSRIEETFPLASRFSDKIVYTGLIARTTAASAAEHFDIVVSAGGGAAGAQLIAQSVNAAKLMSESLQWCVVAGPHMPAEDLQAAIAGAPPNIQIFTFREDFSGLLASARVSISQAGYNTVCDLLQANCRAVLVPFAAGGETEQTTRAMRLEKLGLATVLPEDSLSAVSLATAITQSLQVERPAGNSLDLRGARHTAEILRDKLGQWPSHH